MIIKDGEMKIQVEVDLGFPTSNIPGDQDLVAIRVTDAASRIQFLDLRIPYSEFTKMLSRCNIEVDATVRGLDKIGKQLETRSRVFGVKKPGFGMDGALEQRDEWLSQGWEKVTISGVAGGGQKVLARRWVEKVDEVEP